jgi:hypothetical protein
MNKIFKWLKENIVSVVLIAVLTYFTILNNLYKSTGTNDWNIFRSPALPKLIKLTIAFIVAVVVWEIYKKRKKLK